MQARVLKTDSFLTAAAVVAMTKPKFVVALIFITIIADSAIALVKRGAIPRNIPHNVNTWKTFACNG